MSTLDAVDYTEVITSDVEEKKEKYELEADEKFKVRDLENDFLKAQVELRQLQDRHTQIQEIVKKTQDRFPKLVKELADKRGISTDEYTFNALDLTFVKNQK